MEPEDLSIDGFRRGRSWHKGVELALSARTDFAQISMPAQSRTTPSHPHRIAQNFLPSVADRCHKVVRPLTLAPMNLVHADGLNVFQFPTGQAPVDKPFHRAIDAFPTGVEGPRCLAPGQPPGPPAQKAHHGQGDRPLPFAPGNMLDHDPMRRTVHTPRGVEEPRANPPQRHKQPRPFWKSVVTGGRLAALRAFAPQALVRRNPHRGCLSKPGSKRKTHPVTFGRQAAVLQAA
jgi:hypothetical protein